MRVDVLGPVAVRDGGTAVTGHALGGRRARLLLVALAVADGPVTAERLAAVIWGAARPPTWPVALRGVVRGLRAVAGEIAGHTGAQPLIVTVPSGYQLAPGVE